MSQQLSNYLGLWARNSHYCVEVVGHIGGRRAAQSDGTGARPDAGCCYRTPAERDPVSPGIRPEVSLL
jgi:hypothetical protein